MSFNIAMIIYRCGGTGPADLATTGPKSCCIMHEKPADAISDVLNFENFPHFAWIIDCFTASAQTYNASRKFS